MRRPLPLALLALTAALVAACGGASDSPGGSGSSSASTTSTGGKPKATLSLVAYSTPQVVYDEVIPAFEQTAAGKGIAFKQSYGASGEQSRAVQSGLPADVVAFSLAPDVDKLVKAGKVPANWADAPHDGFVSRSVVALVVRKGNPKGIKTWSDLLKPGVKVLTPNPFTSGSAKWNLLAAYGANGGKAGNDKAGLAYLRELLTKHVSVQDKSGREALQDFVSGNGDVLISYENEAITAQKKGQDVDYVIPDDTIQIENPIAVTSESKDPQAAKAFVSYALSAPAQRQFASWGYRPVDPTVMKANAKRFPKPPGLFTVRDLGGWSKVNDSLFDPDKGSVAAIEQDAGVSTAK